MHACMLQAVFDVKSYQLSFCNYLFVLQAQLPCKKLCQYSLFFLSTFIPTVNFCISYNGLTKTFQFQVSLIGLLRKNSWQCAVKLQSLRDERRMRGPRVFERVRKKVSYKDAVTLAKRLDMLCLPSDILISRSPLMWVQCLYFSASNRELTTAPASQCLKSNNT